MAKKSGRAKARPVKKKQKDENESWLSAKVFVLLAAIFLIVESLGLLAAVLLLAQGQQQPIFGESVNDISNAIYLFAVIMAMTVLILLLLRLRKKRNVLWAIEALAIFATSTVFFGALLPGWELVIALAVVAWRYTHRESVWFRNICSGIAVAGAGSLIGISIGMLPVLAFITALSVYDIIAVFGTKHMVTIGKSVTKQNYAFTMAMPTKAHSFELGNGDLVIPLMTASSVLANGPFINNYLVASLCLGASFIGLMISILLVSKKRVSMPALPPQTMLMLAVIGAALALGL